MGEIARHMRRILKDANFEKVREAKGDHELWEHPITKKQCIVDDGCKSRHTANDALKRAGLPKAF